MCMEAHWNLEYDHGRSSPTKKFYQEPHHPSVSLMDVQKDFGENERDKGNQCGVELALLGFFPSSQSTPLFRGVTSPCWLSL
jgi:hypothetical protein